MTHICQDTQVDPVKQGPLRKIPTQDRSRQRLERIVDAAAHVFGEVGYEAATTEAIAERAEVSIGSLYQFFPNKLALFTALAARYHDRERALFLSLVDDDVLRLSWADLLDRTIDAFYTLHKTDPTARVVWQSFMLSGEILAQGEALNREFAERTEQLLAIYAPRTTADKRALVAKVIVQTLTAMLFLAVRYPAEGDTVIEETKLLVRRYLEPYARDFGPDGAERPGKTRTARRARSR